MLSTEANLLSDQGNLLSAEGNLLSAEGNMLSADGNLLSARSSGAAAMGPHAPQVTQVLLFFANILSLLLYTPGTASRRRARWRRRGG